jgi:HSP20 family protein
MEQTIFNTLFDEIYGEIYGSIMTSLPYKVFEDEDGYQLQIALPGYEKKDIEINLKNNILYLKYQKPEKEISPWKTSFSKRYNIKNGLDINAIEAILENGILSIKFNKTPENKKTIMIK